MRAPPKRKEKTGGPNRAANLCAVALAKAQAAVVASAATTQPASPRRAGGATDDRAHAGGGTRRHASSVPSMSRAAQRGTLLRAASSGAEEERPVRGRVSGRAGAFRTGRRPVTAQRIVARRTDDSKNRDAFGGAVFAYIPSGAAAPRGTARAMGFP